MPVIVLTKSDLCDDLENKLSEVSSVAFGIDVLEMCIRDSYIVGKMEFGGADHGLDRPDGTGGRRSRTGVAVQSRDADPLQLSTRDIPLKEVQKEGVGGQRRSQLDLPAMSVLSQCPHTPCTD